MSKDIVVKIITPLNLLLDCSAKAVLLPGEEGIFQVLPDHACLVASLKTGVVKISSFPREHEYFIYNGIAQVFGRGVNILTEFTKNLADISVNQVLEMTGSLKERLKKENRQEDINILKQSLIQYESLLSYLNNSGEK